MSLKFFSRLLLAPITLALIAGFAASCSTSRSTGSTPPPPPPEPETRPHTPEPPRTLAPGTAQFRGTVMKTDTIPMMQNGKPINGPAAEYAVTFRIDSIKGYGMAFGNPLWVGQSLPLTLPLPPQPPPAPPGAPPPPPMPDLMRRLLPGDVVDGTVEWVNDPVKPFYRMMDFSVR